MTGRPAFRGQPLLLFGGVLLGWLALRIVLWEPPFAPLPDAMEAKTAAPARLAQAVGSTPNAAILNRSPDAVPSVGGGTWRAPAMPSAPAPLWILAPTLAPAVPVLPPVLPPVEVPLDPPHVAIGHGVMLALGLSQMQVPQALLAYVQNARQPAATARAEPHRSPAPVSRWSADGWLMLRADGDNAAPGQVLSDRPSYGRSQAGAVVRFDLAPASALRPKAHLRGAAALSGVREREVAAGLSVRPLPGVPVRAVVEARASETGGDTLVRPAAYAVTELPPVALPGGLRGEAYLQGGYVGGDFATAFVDGQARVERPIAVGTTELSAGAGAWGGAQKGSGRLDIGPTAAVRFRLGEAHGRVAADYRFRVAGEAEPKSGPAVTVSAGF